MLWAEPLTLHKRPKEVPNYGKYALFCTVTLVVLLPLGSAVMASAQESDAKWLVGKWVGYGRTNVSQADYQVEFKEDGTFEGSSKSPLGTSDYRQGRWKIDGATILVEYVIDNPRSQVHGTKGAWALKRDGEELRGDGGRAGAAGSIALTLKRAK